LTPATGDLLDNGGLPPTDKGGMAPVDPGVGPQPGPGVVPRPDAGGFNDPGASAPSTNVGAQCSSNADCFGQGSGCMNLPGGYCVIAGCSEGPACPDGSACFTFDGGASYCLESCASSSECREAEGYVCDADKACWTGPDQPDPPSAGDIPIGGACERDSDCADQGAGCYPERVQGSDTGFQGGYCVKFDCGQSGCPQGSACLTVSQDGTTACFDSCGDGDSCRAGYQCTDQSNVCWPGCNSDSDCPEGSACKGDEGFCVDGWTNEPFECTDQQFEVNDVLGQAHLLDAPGSWDGVQLCTGDEDWYSVEMPNATLITLGIEFQHILGDLDLLAYDSGGNFLGSRLWLESYGAQGRHSETGSEFLSVMSLSGVDSSAFRVRGWAGATGTYKLQTRSTEWRDGLKCTDFFSGEECAGYNGTQRGILYQFPFADPDDPYVGAGYTFDSYANYRWLRRELIMLVRYAIHETQKRFEGTGPIGLIDMADIDGITPGFDVGDPRHPESTHDQGGNLDIAYYQTDGDSSADAVCGPNNTAHNGYFCTSTTNHIMDVPRTAYFMAMLNRHTRMRVIGVDKLLAPLIIAELSRQQEAGWISSTLRTTTVNRMAYGDGWPFHHHHMHVSMWWWSQGGFNQLALPPRDGCGFRMPGDGPPLD